MGKHEKCGIYAMLPETEARFARRVWESPVTTHTPATRLGAQIRDAPNGIGVNKRAATQRAGHIDSTQDVRTKWSYIANRRDLPNAVFDDKYTSTRRNNNKPSFGGHRDQNTGSERKRRVVKRKSATHASQHLRQ